MSDETILQRLVCDSVIEEHTGCLLDESLLEDAAKHIESLEARNKELLETLNLLHKDVCYQISGNYEPTRPSVETFDVVSSVLFKNS